MQPFRHNRHGPKIGGSAPILGRGARSPFNTMSLGSRPTCLPSGVYRAIWPQQIWAEKLGTAVPLWGGGPGSPSNTMWPGPRPTCMLSFILIRPIIWPQYINVTDRTEQDRQRSSSIGRPETIHKREHITLLNHCRQHCAQRKAPVFKLLRRRF